MTRTCARCGKPILFDPEFCLPCLIVLNQQEAEDDDDD